MFLLSFHDRDPLAAAISGDGWRVISARRKDNLTGRFLSSHALIAIVDLRGAAEDSLTAITEIAGLGQHRGIAILALADPSVQKNIAQLCYDAGATHFLDIANAHADLHQAINFAYRYVENIRGGKETTLYFNDLLAQADEQWFFSKKDLKDNWVSEKLKSNLNSTDFDHYPVSGMYRQLSGHERKRVRGALGRLKSGSAQAAVPHLLNGEKILHHLHDSGERIYGRIERNTDGLADHSWSGQDLLSGLRNGSAARSWMRNCLEQGNSLGLVILGLKNIGTINAAYGRAIGDEVMRRVGQRLIAETTDHPPDDCMVARLDGQNFGVAMTFDVSAEGGIQKCVDYAGLLLGDIFESITIEGREIGLVARAGIAVGEDSTDESLLIRRATLALAEAMISDASPIKVSGSSEKNILMEHQLEGDLAHALERGEIAIALQPQIKVDTGQLAGAEALARWNHPKLGFLGAATLFSVAERAGLMELLSIHIHKLAFATAAEWPDSLSFLRLSVNITAGDLANTAFVQNIIQAIDEAGFDPGRTTLEITESELIGDVRSAAQRLSAIRKKGLHIAIDDFGTGYSSLSYLKNLPLDYLKIDSGLTSDIGGSVKDQVVVKSIIDMARSLDLSVIAEGVETEAQLEMLARQGCEYFQGFLRSGPISPDEFEIFALKSN